MILFLWYVSGIILLAILILELFYLIFELIQVLYEKFLNSVNFWEKAVHPFLDLSFCRESRYKFIVKYLLDLPCFSILY